MDVRNHARGDAGQDGEGGIGQSLVAALATLAPQTMSEGRIDFDKLKIALVGELAESPERYGISWAGKRESFLQIQEPTAQTFLRDAEKSRGEDSKNIFIEGDNLEALKVLQRSYYGKVKMIYIDPPYNTGHDFIYNDRFARTKKEEQMANGSIDEAGNVINSTLYQVNTKDGGHYHSDWLSMMYPRLFMARTLLREDGVIFVSIDDNEVHNLRIVMDELFGEENFEGQIHWRRRHNQPNDPTKLIALVAEHILVYSRDSEKLKKSGVGKLPLTGVFSNPDNDPRGDWNSKPWKVGSNQNGSKYSIILPSGKIILDEWMGEEATYRTLLKDNRIYFSKDGDGLPRKKIFKTEREEAGQSATNWFENGSFGNNQEASAECAEIFDGNKNIFDNPKPVKLLKNLILLGNLKDGDIVLDFFAGSGTTAHAVMAQNAEDGGNRRWICVQLSEKCKPESEAAKAGYTTIADIARTRIERAGEKITAEHPDKKIDTGFAAYKLGPSNFKIWNPHVQGTEAITKQMFDMAESVQRGATDAHILDELVLKCGYMLTAPRVEKRVGDGAYILLGGRV